MPKIIVFNQVSMDGYIADANGDMSWAHKSDPEWNEFVGGNAGGESRLLFGRKTYEMMARFWPTPMALERSPHVAARMNQLSKVVFSRTLDEATWSNTRLVKDGLADEVRKLKRDDGPDMVILGSGSIVAQLAQERLIDELQMVVNPIVLGKGKTMFEGVSEKLPMKLAKSRAFDNGNVVLTYEPAA